MPIDTRAIVDEIEAAVRAAVPTLPAGTRGVERQFRDGSELSPSEYPHAFLVDFSISSGPLPFGQSTQEIALQVHLWADGVSVDDMLDLSSAVLSQIVDTQVPGWLDRWRCSEIGISVDPAPDSRARRVAVFLVEGGVIT